ncbi:MAG: dut [Clostridiales bacterium]|jgi:dUTP pyrophosphatase|nr:dut [Clostridiales bacterium]
MMNLKVAIEQTDTGRTLPLPKYMSAGAAGLDLYADVPVDEPITLEPGDYKLIPTGIKIALPEGFEAQIRGRSGLAAKYAIGIPNAPGTIDADYRGEIKVILINWGKEAFVINRGERIAQMVINKIEQAEWKIVNSLDETQRGEGGFGHSGR